MFNINNMSSESPSQIETKELPSIILPSTAQTRSIDQSRSVDTLPKMKVKSITKKKKVDPVVSVFQTAQHNRILQQNRSLQNLHKYSQMEKNKDRMVAKPKYQMILEKNNSPDMTRPMATGNKFESEWRKTRAPRLTKDLIEKHSIKIDPEEHVSQKLTKNDKGELQFLLRRRETILQSKLTPEELQKIQPPEEKKNYFNENMKKVVKLSKQYVKDQRGRLEKLGKKNVHLQVALPTESSETSVEAS